jgi:hypothetical protein
LRHRAETEAGGRGAEAGTEGGSQRQRNRTPLAERRERSVLTECYLDGGRLE